MKRPIKDKLDDVIKYNIVFPRIQRWVQRTELTGKYPKDVETDIAVERWLRMTEKVKRRVYKELKNEQTN
jgi:hypothetical protein